MLEPALQAIATYDRAHGHYIVNGCRVTALGQNDGKQIFSIEEGEANINGFKHKRLAALRHEEPEDYCEGIVPSETHLFTSKKAKATKSEKASFTFETYYFPIATVHSILLTKEKTTNVTRGAVASGRDGVPDKSIVSFVKVTQDKKEFKEGVDFKKTGDTIDWSLSGDEPKPGSTYEVTYHYRAKVNADKITAREITVLDGAEGGDIIVSYTYKLPRIDRIGLNAQGNVVYIQGISADNPIAPSVPDDILSLATITNNWLDYPHVDNNGTRVAPYAEMWRYFNRVLDLDRLLQLEKIKSNVDSKEPVSKKGMIADPFLDDSLRDEGIEQTGAIGHGLLRLAIEPTFYYATLNEPVTLDWENEVIHCD
uniref:Phage related protein, virulence-associated n=1 Tax=Bartonella schoenbuchensis TaxID=165694 RepID=A0A024LQT8_9HYPH|nr:phage related protein, virulence-associated [Bartonella schoenbuchensis]